MKKRILFLALVLSFVLPFVPAAFAATTPDFEFAFLDGLSPNIGVSAGSATPGTVAADKLHILGLFQGVGTTANGLPDFDLLRSPTRAEAVAMFVRLLGRSDEAHRGIWTTPFTDVPDWALPYVGYAYANDLTNGISATAFGSQQAATATQYITFVLRALGYTSGVDFQWDRAWELSDSLRFTFGQFNENTMIFLRSDIATVSFDALRATFSGSNKSLYRSLIDAGVFTQAAWDVAGTPIVPRSNFTLPNRRLTGTERADWISDYRALGGATVTELEVIRLINIERANHNLAQVELDETLMMAARFFAQQANDLRGLHSGAHNFGPYATDPEARHGASANVAEAFGARLRWNGGNWFSGGSMTAEALVTGWMNSDGHRRYILSPEHRFIGAGQFPGGISYMFLSENPSTIANAA
jgi:hypothetical protein